MPPLPVHISGPDPDDHLGGDLNNHSEEDLNNHSEEDPDIVNQLAPEEAKTLFEGYLAELELLGEQGEGAVGGIIGSIINLAYRMLEKDEPRIHDEYGNTFFFLSEQMEQFCDDPELVEAVNDLHQAWSDWAEMEM